MPEQKRCHACDHPRERTGGSACVRSSWSAMKARAKLGCVPCGILSEGIEKVLHDCKPQQEDDEDWQLRLDFNMHGAERSLEAIILGTDTVLSFFCSEVTPWIFTTLPNLPVAFEVPSRTSSPESLAWVREQIQECQKHDSFCNTLSRRSALPKRVINVEASPVFLYETQGETAPYICLSHVWGHRPFVRTKSGNLASHKQSLDIDNLPQTFRDAIRYTRELGVRYLWIDSLCIIQDSHADWTIEASKMASIYQGSFLVLSAASSESPYGGLFAEFPYARCRTYTVEVHHPALNSGEEITEKIHVRRSLTHVNRRSLMRSLSSPQHQGPALLTLTRGWIFQERFLAARVLHFGPEELFWECIQFSACQCTSSPGRTHTNDTKTQPPRWYTQMIARSSRPKSYYRLSAFEITDKIDLHLEELSTCWHHLVEDYTKLELTFDKDIFPAISGLARLMCCTINGLASVSRQLQAKPTSTTTEIQDLLNRVTITSSADYGTFGTSGGEEENGNWKGVKYWAGLWSHSLHRDLLWRVGSNNREDRTSLHRRPAKWRAPSWSWASVKGPVEFLDQTEGLEVRYELVEDVDWLFPGSYFAGELLDQPGKNILVLNGRTIPAVANVKVAAKAELTRRDTIPEAWDIIELDIFKGHLKNIWVDDGAEWLRQEENRTVYCFLVGVKKTKALCFLVLRQLRGEDTTLDETGETYQRVGVAEVFGGPPGPGSWTDRLLALGSDLMVKIR
ncbi:Heterokaryon incompatibility protein (HET) domain containing protein [Naviculisporaceae sp. PSN 640]